MITKNIATIVPFKKNNHHCPNCNIENSPKNHFCRSCGKVINPTAEKKSPEKCLHDLVKKTRLCLFNYCPTCCEPIQPISDDDYGIML